MWLAHYSFHFITSFDTIIPVTQRFVAGFGYDGLGSPNWICSCCKPAPDWLLTCELLLLTSVFYRRCTPPGASGGRNWVPHPQIVGRPSSLPSRGRSWQSSCLRLVFGF